MSATQGNVGPLATFAAYEAEAARTAGLGSAVNWALGLASEAGEVAGQIRREEFTGAPADDEHLVEELGDVLWYLAAIAASVGTTLERIATRNIEKLRRRHGENFRPHTEQVR